MWTFRENICHVVEAPVDVSNKIKKLATSVAEKAIKSLEGAGVFAVELFLTEDDQVFFGPSTYFFKIYSSWSGVYIIILVLFFL